jgi:UDP-2,3-diacylglucosamine hydrolase
MATLFVSDLHLPPAASPLRERFARLLAGPARGCEALYILGDLFEYWVGDDAGLLAHAPEVAALAALTASGVPVYFQHGNRDFLVHRDFARETGAKILPDPLRLDLYGVPTLLSHGDLFCTADLPYQRWRRFSRFAPAQAVFRALPLSFRLGFADRARMRSAAHQRNQADAIMDVSEDAVRAAFVAHDVTRIIHGHTHRPALHRYDVDGVARERYVLADWREDLCEFLRIDLRGIERVRLD